MSNNSSINMLESIFRKKKLSTKESRYKNFFELIPSGIVIHKNGTIIFGNKFATKLMNAKDSKELIGKNLMSIVDPEFHDAINQRINYINNGGISTPFFESKVINFNKEIIEIESASISFPYEGNNMILVIFNNITERKAIEYNKIKTEFIVNISHELKTPINVILSTLQLLELKINNNKNNEKEDYIGYIETMKQNCYRLIRLVNNLIDITKIDSGYLSINLRNCNIVNVIENITLSVSEYIENKGLQLIFDTDVEEKIMACDPEQIERIILNLISNSVKFTKPGGLIKVNISDQCEKILVSVEDTGIGISKERHEQIFQKFVQVNSSLKNEQEGSGIGLCLVKSLVELHEGNIYVISEEGKGSKFVMEFPVRIIQSKDDKINDSIYLEETNIERINVEFSDAY